MQAYESKAMKAAAICLPNCNVCIHSGSLPPPTPCSKPLPRRRRAVSWQGSQSYPSPPMSDPPSPSKRTPSTLPRTSSPERTAITISLSAPSGLPARTVAPSALQQPPMFLTQPHFATHAGPSMAGPMDQSFGHRASHNRNQSMDQGSVILSRVSSRSDVNYAISEGGPGARAARRTKAHVANACGNCKRAHLSCDIQRPCQRCISTGKEDSCRDVPHKKRGRPRLREDVDFPGEAAGSSRRPSESGPVGMNLPPDRPVAQARHRRGESLRLLRSQTTQFAVTSPPSDTLRARPRALTQQGPPPSLLPPASAVPVAFLDLDLVIMRANAAFQHLFPSSQEVRGRRLDVIARPADADSFQVIRNRLREEREARDPAYLPPIHQPGQDPLDGLSERDIDGVTRGFRDTTYMWTFNFFSSGSPGVERTLPCRVRLGKTSVYFVTLALPPLPSAQAPRATPHSLPSPVMSGYPTASALQPMSAFQDPMRQRRASLVQTAPLSPFFQGTIVPATQQRTAAGPSLVAASYPPPHQLNPYMQPQYRSLQSPPFLPTPMQPIAESMGMTPTSDPFTPHFNTRRLSQVVFPQLDMTNAPRPPPSIASIASGSQLMQSPPPASGRPQSSSSESNAERSPKKRRRMEIGDVLQK